MKISKHKLKKIIKEELELETQFELGDIVEYVEPLFNRESDPPPKYLGLVVNPPTEWWEDGVDEIPIFIAGHGIFGFNPEQLTMRNKYRK